MSNVTWRLVLTITICTWGVFSSLSYFATISNNLQHAAQPFFNTSYQDHYGLSMSDGLFNTLWPLAASIYFIGAVFGSMPISLVAEGVGRRNGLLLASFGTTTFAVVSSISPVVDSVELYLACRVVLGFFCALGAGILPMYLAEVSPTDKRGFVGAIAQIFVAIGILGGTSMPLIPEILNLNKIWPAALAIPGCITFFETIWLLFCPGSPRHLYLTLDEPEKAKQSVQFFQGAGQVEGYMKGLEDEKQANVLKTDNPEDNKTLSVWGVICEDSVRHNLLVSIVIIIGMQMDGSAGVFGFSHDVFIDAGMNQSTAKLASIGVGVSVLFFAIVSVLVMEKAGRRKLILLGYITQLLTLIALQICNCGIEYFGWKEAAEYSLMVSIYIYVGGYSIKSCVVWVAVSELFPQKARSGAMTINMSLNWTLNWATMFAFLPWQNVAGAWSFLPYIISMIIVVGVVTMHLPETSGSLSGRLTMGMMDQVNVEYNKREVEKTRKILHTLRVGHLCQLGVILTVVLMGPGLHVRQGWKGYLNDTSITSSSCSLIECGVMGLQNNTNCLLPNNHHLKAVATLHGYNGLATFNLWYDLHLQGQYGTIALICLVMAMAIPLSLMSCEVIKTPPAKRKKYTMAIQGTAIVGLIIIQCLNWWYCWCGNYSTFTMGVYEKHMQEWVDKGMFPVEEENKLVKCYVIAYSVAAVLAFISMGFFILDAKLFYTLAQKDTAMQEPELGRAGKDSGIPSAMPTTTPQSTSATNGATPAGNPSAGLKLGSY